MTDVKNEALPEVIVEPIEGEMISAIRLNLTPDSYNSLVKIMHVLQPESTQAEVNRQYQEKQSILNTSSFKQTIKTSGVRESRMTNNW